MEAQIDLEQLLLKILSISPDGVDYQDIIDYQKIVLENCYDHGIHAYVLPGVSKNELERVVRDYPKLFRESICPGGRYYSYSQDFHRFDIRNGEIINSILDDSLIDYQQSYAKKLVLEKKEVI